MFRYGMPHCRSIGAQTRFTIQIGNISSTRGAVMEYQLYEYRDTEDPAWLREAIEIALDWAHYHVDLGHSEKFSWYDMAAGIRAARLAFMLDRILSERVDAGDVELGTLVNLADLHAQKLQERGFLATGNHAIFQPRRARYVVRSDLVAQFL